MKKRNHDIKCSPQRGQALSPEHNFDRLFTPEEANELIPALEIMVRELQVATRELRENVRQIAEHVHDLTPASLQEIIGTHPRLRVYVECIADMAGKIESLGCLLKDIDHGLVDFPYEIDEGEVVFLCWQYGEQQVIAWHPIEGGFMQRKPLRGTTKPYLN